VTKTNVNPIEVNNINPPGHLIAEETESSRRRCWRCYFASSWSSFFFGIIIDILVVVGILIDTTTGCSDYSTVATRTSP